MKNFIQSGKTLSLLLTATIASGAGILVGTVFGVAESSGVSGDTIAVVLEGVFELPKSAGALTVGAKLYWDNTAKVVTATSSGNTFCGYAWTAAAGGDATVQVKLQTA